MRVRAARLRSAVRGLRSDDGGQIMLLAIGFVVVALALVAVVTAVTSVQLERKRLMTIADAAAAHAAGDFDEESLHAARAPDPGAPHAAPGLELTDARVADSVAEYLAASRGTLALRDVRVVSATTPDGRTAVVELAGVARPALVGWLVDVVDDDGGVRIGTRGAARGG